MQRKNILFVGYGDIASRIGQHFPQHRLVGITRSAQAVSDDVELRLGDAADIGPQLIESECWDAVIVTLTPREFTDTGYLAGYVEPLRAVLNACRHNPPGMIFFASSTAVYAQDEGQWVDELSDTAAQTFSGKRLLEAENLLRSSGLEHCILRFAGIYGPGRDMLIRQVKQGKGGNANFTNRIHAEDCAGFVAHLLNQYFMGQTVAQLFVVSDDSPASGLEVRGWLAEQLGGDPQDLKPSDSTRGGNKRCCNKRLHSTGYRLQYPDYRAGYAKQLRA